MTRCALLAALIVAGCASAPPAVAPRAPAFALLGDVPYSQPHANLLDGMIERINRQSPAFVVHLGDITSGNGPCTDEWFEARASQFARFAAPFVLLPGDNEWTDCHRPNSGSMDPLERLAFVRRMFFPEPTQSLGKTPLRVTPQSTDAQYSKFVENARWERAGVVFATLHIPGSNNNLQRNQAAVNEYIERNAANLAWIDAAFARAQETNAKGVVLAFQAHLRFDKEPPETDLRSGFNDTLNALKSNAIAWGKPVLLIHGDQHHLVIDQPLIGPGRRRIMNVTRLMVHGDSEVHATLINVDTDNPDLFSFKPVYIRENIPPFKPATKP